MDDIEVSRLNAERLADEAAAIGRNDALLAAMVAAVRLTGVVMLRYFDSQARYPATAVDLVEAIHANDRRALDVLRSLIERVRPEAGWVEDELAGGVLPNGEWWIVDPMEGNINHVQGLAEWGISATLVRDNVPVMTAVYEPVTNRLYTAVRGHGAAYVNGLPMRVSAKRELAAAIMSTGQAKPGESVDTNRRIGESVTAMLEKALLVRMTVPATFELVRVAGGHIDGFWQFSNVRSGQAAGALLVSEAGGVVSDIDGRPWTLASDDFLASAPGMHRAFVEALKEVA